MVSTLFHIDQVVRVTDLNYGNHVGISQMHALAHQARYALLASHGLSELNIFGIGLLVLESNIKMLTESHLNDLLRFSVSLEIISKTKFKCMVSVGNAKTSKPVAAVEDTLICFDYEKKRPVGIPDGFKILLQ